MTMKTSAGKFESSTRRADQFLDRLSDVPRKQKILRNVLESRVDLSKLRLLYDRLPDRLKKEAVNSAHLVVMLELMLERFDKISKDLEALKESRREL
jgi:hypothetical protein